MGLKSKKSKNSKSKMSTKVYPLDDIIETVAAIDVHGHKPNPACRALMEKNADLLAQHGLSYKDWNNKEGQISGGLHRTLSRLVETSEVAYDKAIAAGLEVDNPRPVSSGRPSMPAIPPVLIQAADGDGDGKGMIVMGPDSFPPDFAEDTDSNMAELIRELGDPE